MIVTRSLGFAHAGAVPLRFPDVQVPQGGRLLLQGPSGAGKSTWLALLHETADACGATLVVATHDARAAAWVSALEGAQALWLTAEPGPAGTLPTLSQTGPQRLQDRRIAL